MNALKAMMLAATLVSITNAALADETPRSMEPKTLVIKAQGEKARKQYCYSTFTIDEKGNWAARTLFSNGKNLDGDHFQAILVIKDTNGRNCLALNQVRGMRGAMACDGSCEREVVHSGATVLTSHDLTDQYTYQCTGWDRTDDLLMATGAVVAIGCSAAGGGDACSTSLAVAMQETGNRPKDVHRGCVP